MVEHSNIRVLIRLNQTSMTTSTFHVGELTAFASGELRFNQLILKSPTIKKQKFADTISEEHAVEGLKKGDWSTGRPETGVQGDLRLEYLRLEYRET